MITETTPIRIDHDGATRERMVHLECVNNHDKACCGYKFPPDARYMNESLECVVCAQMEYRECPCGG